MNLICATVGWTAQICRLMMKQTATMIVHGISVCDANATKKIILRVRARDGFAINILMVS